MGLMLIFNRTMRSLRCGVLLTLSFSSIAYAQEIISSQKDLGRTLEHAVMCKVDALGVVDGSEFSGGPGDAFHQLQALGVGISVKNEDYSGGIRYHFPDGVKVFGYDAMDALYFAESTTLFFVTLRADVKFLGKVNKILGLSPVATGNPDGYGYVDNIDVRFIRKLREPGVDFPYTIFSGIKNSGGRDYIVVGCQNLAW